MLKSSLIFKKKKNVLLESEHKVEYSRFWFKPVIKMLRRKSLRLKFLYVHIHLATRNSLLISKSH